MHVEVENAEEYERSQSSCGEGMDRLEHNEKPRQILDFDKYLLIIIKLIIIAKGWTDWKTMGNLEKYWFLLVIRVNYIKLEYLCHKVESLVDDEKWMKNELKTNMSMRSYARESFTLCQRWAQNTVY